MKSKFDFNEIVLVNSSKKSLSAINGRKGVVKGKSQSETDPAIFAYAIHTFDSDGELEEGWFIFERDLKTTNNFYTEKSDKPKTVIKVKVDPETGEGKIAE